MTESQNHPFKTELTDLHNPGWEKEDLKRLPEVPPLHSALQAEATPRSLKP